MDHNWKNSFLVTLTALIMSLIIASLLISTLRDSLNTTRETLSSTQTQLTSTTAQYNLTKTALDNTETQLAAVNNQLNATQNQLSQTNSQLSWVTSQYNRAASDMNLIRTQYVSLVTQVDSRFGLTKKDRQSYITPSDPLVSSKVQEITGGYNGDNNKLWRDYFSMYDWVANNIKYSYDSYMPVLPSDPSGSISWKADCWRFPSETLNDKASDCEDMALLLASMLINYNKSQFAIWAIDISSNDPGTSGHLAVAFPVTGGELAILDPAGHYYSRGQGIFFTSETASRATANLLSYWSTQIPGAYVSGVFSATADQQFTTTDSFLTWLSSWFGRS